MMNFALSDEQQMVRKMVRSFVDKEIMRLPYGQAFGQNTSGVAFYKGKVCSFILMCTKKYKKMPVNSI
jgi:hypothetical protein